MERAALDALEAGVCVEEQQRNFIDKVEGNLLADREPRRVLQDGRNPVHLRDAELLRRAVALDETGTRQFTEVLEKSHVDSKGEDTRIVEH